MMILKDDDPVWEQHSGGHGHHGREWVPSDGPRAVAFYRSLAGNARMIFDLLMDQPGEQVDADRIAAKISGPWAGGTERVRSASGCWEPQGDRRAEGGIGPPSSLLLVEGQGRVCQLVCDETGCGGAVPGGTPASRPARTWRLAWSGPVRRLPRQSMTTW